MIEKKAEKNYGIEFLRILSMFMVVVLHIFRGERTIYDAANLSGNRMAMIFIHSFCFVAVNCFALISGYVMCNSKFRMSKICQLWAQTFFYSAGFRVLFSVIKKEFIAEKLIKSFLPISTSQYWYVSAYFGMFFLIPLLNTAINNMEKKVFERTLLLCFTVFCVNFVFLQSLYDPFGMQGGYSTLWLALMYLTGGYIKKYSVAEKIKKSTALILYFVMSTVTFLSRPILTVLTRKIFGKVIYEDAFVRYDTLFVTLASLGLFVFCVRLSFSERTKKVIGFFSPAALGVYLIHYHPNVFTDLIKKVPLNLPGINIFLLPVIVFSFAFAIFIVCSLIEKVRIWIFKVLHINSIFVRFEDWTQRIYEKIYNKFTVKNAVE